MTSSIKGVNQWLSHVQRFREQFPDKSYKECLVGARDTYTKREKPAVRSEPKVNPWMAHIDKWKQENPTWKENYSYKDVLKLCKETYTRTV